MKDKSPGKNLFGSFLRDRGRRMTKERAVILQKIFDGSGHFDAESLYVLMRGTGLKASRASVYRTLNLLHECGLIERVRKTDRGSVYESTFGRKHHDHMLCLQCGKVLEFYSEELERLQESICIKQGFQGKSHTLEIRGLCRKCRKKKK